jgi:hypothetical protein
MKNKLYFSAILGTVAVIVCLNMDFGGDIDLSKIEYNVLRFNFSRKIFGDSCTYHYVTKSDIMQAEKMLRKAFDDYNKTATYPRNHEDYGRQYIGAKTSGGDIIIYVNCFAGPDDYEQKWLFRVIVHDGGDLFFEGMINLTKGEVIYFEPHASV